jgi:two-component system response regulator RegX3
MNTHQRKILVVEDDAAIRDALQEALGADGHAVVCAPDGGQAVRLFLAQPFDLVLLDLMLPVMNGYDVCRKIREKNATVPVIMLTAKGEEIDKVLGLELGADDYVTKPYRLRELIARIRAVLRRREPSSHADVAVEVIEVGNVRLEVDTRRCFVNGDEIKLRKKEFALLEMLLSNPGRVMTRDQLIDQIWGHDYVGDTKTLDVHIKRLRSLVEEHPKEPRHITTVRGVGYRFDA